MVTIVKLGIAANQHQNSLLFEDLALKKKNLVSPAVRVLCKRALLKCYYHNFPEVGLGEGVGFGEERVLYNLT